MIEYIKDLIICNRLEEYRKNDNTIELKYKKTSFLMPKSQHFHNNQWTENDVNYKVINNIIYASGDGGAIIANHDTLKFYNNNTLVGIRKHKDNENIDFSNFNNWFDKDNREDILNEHQLTHPHIIGDHIFQQLNSSTWINTELIFFTLLLIGLTQINTKPKINQITNHHINNDNDLIL